MEDFKKEEDFRLSWWLRTIFYLPFGMIIEEIHLYRMHKLNKDWEKYFNSVAPSNKEEVI